MTEFELHKLIIDMRELIIINFFVFLIASALAILLSQYCKKNHPGQFRDLLVVLYGVLVISFLMEWLQALSGIMYYVNQLGFEIRKSYPYMPSLGFINLVASIGMQLIIAIITFRLILRNTNPNS